MAIESRKLSGNNPRLTIDLTEVFDSRVPDSEAFRQSYGQAVIDEIRERSTGNIDRKSNRFKNYSKEYAASLEFQAHGKSIGDPNLQLTGDMLGLMDVVSTTRNTVTIGWDESDEAAKAHGHITGNVGVRRDFFGLPDEVYKGLSSEFTQDLRPAEEASFASTLLTLREIFSLGQS